MLAIDNATAVPNRPAANPAGAPGWFTEGNPAAGQPATVLSADWLNEVQAEILAVLAAAAIAPNKTKSDQLATAIQQLAASAISNATSPPVGDNSRALATTIWVNNRLDGVVNVDCSGGADVVLTPAQYGCALISLQGALSANRNVIFPTQGGPWVIYNGTTGGFAVTCKTPAGSGVSPARNRYFGALSDGANLTRALTDFTSIDLQGASVATAADGDTSAAVASTAFAQRVAAIAAAPLGINVAGGADVVLTAAQAAYGILVLVGALTANIKVVFPNNRQWAVLNATTGAFSVNCVTAGGGGYLVRQGFNYRIYADAVNMNPLGPQFFWGTAAAPALQTNEHYEQYS